MTIDPISALSPANRATTMSFGAPTPKPSASEVTKAAQQFEAIMVRQLLSPAIEPMMSGGLGGDSGSGSGGGVYSYMLTDVLATSVTQGGGLGLAEVIGRQFTSATPVAPIK